MDALGNPVRFLLTQGQASEYTQADELIAGFSADYVLADKGYDSDEFVAAIKAGGGQAVIPPRSNRRRQRAYDKHIYKARNLVERFFQKIKNYRRIATRYERLGEHYASLLCLVATVIWLA